MYSSQEGELKSLPGSALRELRCNLVRLWAKDFHKISKFHISGSPVIIKLLFLCSILLLFLLLCYFSLVSVSINQSFVVVVVLSWEG